MMALCDVIRLGLWAGHARQKDDWEEFCGMLKGAGMDRLEIVEYWHGIDRAYEPAQSQLPVRSNTELSQKLGILLDSRKLPRNLLLYRLTECMAPGLISVSIETVRRRNAVLEGRWEYVSPNGCPYLKKSVLHLRFRDVDTVCIPPLWKLLCNA